MKPTAAEIEWRTDLGVLDGQGSTTRACGSLEHEDLQSGPKVEQAPRCRETCGSGPDDGDVNLT
ncbi:hypothetical protein GCM10007888_59800 [Methylobacterium oxalidis]|uniref:Uncharacterized protein n=1 Tax=Methylobacterium oxalidis TaxID=944322 RepID=A0ABQ6DTX5_9HYPH|nr:hypothetical protein GCM10007888_59800 [Methylobacterium oxalidis]